MAGDGVNDLLMVIRAIHFAATAITAGSLVFRAVVAEPALRSAEAAAIVVRTQTRRVVWIGLVVTAASGVIWLLLQASAMSGHSFGEAMTADVLLTVVNETQFGLVFEIRLALIIILAACLAYDQVPWSRWPALVSALGLASAIAWTGHAGSTTDEMGILHLTADTMHLVAATAWLGGLVSLVLLLAMTRRYHAHAWASFSRDVTQRFSTLGIVCVGTLLGSGIINALILVGSLNALIDTEYGRLLMLKISLFFVMLAVAAVNRFWLTPRLALPSGCESQLNSLRQLTRNSMIEIALGLTIYGIVGVLGTLHPAIHLL